MSDKPRTPPLPPDKIVSRREEELTETQKRWEREYGQEVPVGAKPPKLPPAVRPERVKHRDDLLAEEADDDAPPLELAEAARQRPGAVFEDLRPPLVSRILRWTAPLAAVVAAAAFFGTAFHDALRPAARIVEVPEGGPAPSPTFYLDVRSRPAAEIRIDGLVSGTTPALLNTTCGDGSAVSVELVAPGHRPYRTSVKCVVGRTTKVDVVLKPAD